MYQIVILEATVEDRIFGLDFQLGFDAFVQMLAVGFLFFFLSYVLWNPARTLLRKRKEKVESEMENAKTNMASADALKKEYEEKLTNAEKDVDVILAEGRKKALERENRIVNEANEEAKKIRERAEREIELEKSKVKDEVKQEMIGVASAIAGKFVSASLDTADQDKLIDDTLKEMGDKTWQS